MSISEADRVVRRYKPGETPEELTRESMYSLLCEVADRAEEQFLSEGNNDEFDTALLRVVKSCKRLRKFY